MGVRVEVLSLTDDGSHEPRDVEQFKGEGRIAARGFRHPHYVPGQVGMHPFRKQRFQTVVAPAEGAPAAAA